MLFNQTHTRVEDFSGGDSLCPLCNGALIAKRGDIVTWHWAHKCAPAGRDGCPFHESQWHLAWKAAYLSCPSWTVEHPIVVNGSKYIIDAMNTKTGAVREFVHSLSPYYRAKHQALLGTYTNVWWLFDGTEFGSKRSARCRNGGYRRLLKPRAIMAAQELAPLVWVHYGQQVFKHWRDNVWYPRESKLAKSVTERFCIAYAARPREAA